MNDEHIRIRAAGPDDELAVREVLEGAGLGVDGLELEGDSVFWLLTHDGEPVGAVGLEHAADGGDGGASLLRGAAVLPDFRGQGLGRALVLSAVTGAQLRGDSALYLFSLGGDWHGFGFEPTTLAELTLALGDVPQVRRLRAGGALPGPECWVRRLNPARQAPVRSGA